LAFLATLSEYHETAGKGKKIFNESLSFARKLGNLGELTTNALS